MAASSVLKQLVKKHGTPLFIIDHAVIRRNYAIFKKYLPRVQAYYAVKALPDPEVVKTLFDAGASFDVASMPELSIVYEYIRDMPAKQRQDWIWDKIIYAHPIKTNETLQELDQYKPLVTFDNREEIQKIRKYAPRAGLALRLKVANTGAMVELSSKFGAAPGEAVDLILEAHNAGLVVEGLSFHVGSQTTNFDNYVQAINLAANIYKEAKDRGYDKMNLLDIGGGFPAPYDPTVKPFRKLARKINAELERLFPPEIQILAEPGRFMVATAATSVSKIIGKAVLDGKLCYYVDDGVYHTFSGILFDHCQYHFSAFKTGPKQICTVFGPTCDALDCISMSEELPSDLKLGDYLYSKNIGAYSIASSTRFNGFPPAKIVHINQ
ncbi:MAG: decarboxylase [Candidatus Raymondbacteria bacterium RifOxyA12_full_50_37]|uniref:ornithine decarboxylase n=1 Tax=Candidatus Raymondbacteria bacterium RIFOXYD12_FULL_49_13 TaxID=1817890 RepID=A0A1F7F4Y8_UNCRA|nr:MAG: decarboxylase [Candidatus Raymondbacteria bacterium RifOxyA12_full_50_37]OGJ91903.1 MAG: decarboxylase [Candidatus Raymondbacteria bacterium RIFOXYA2_FULL_49_16]OGJ91944.1 MAG: decarboxylase [Candidatus Raymondbacteria bacterium RifOxyB12_full_50_8]OGJ96017.1 MAG: decarboxylase [Candidatus Raymondbacteria bacterium RifOxyC12_full_50_8]OGJ98059.1 MAG: decarboxylase [Candidatus Raymondbacteria bacterium RIFOXYC2_FULL_50_21]OGK01648.1 MAG: decarboxylase [Candidatus Raymondbacteria bacteri